MVLATQRPRRSCAAIDYFEPEMVAKRARPTPRPTPDPAAPESPAAAAVKPAAAAFRQELLETVLGTLERRAARRAPQACGFGGDHGTTGGFHDDDGNFYRVGQWVWALVEEKADTQGKEGKARDGLKFYCPSVIVETYVAGDETNSSRINLTVDLMAAVNQQMVDAFLIDANGLLPDLGEHGWALLPQWIYTVTAVSILGAAIPQRLTVDAPEHKEAFALVGLINTTDELCTESFHPLTAGMREADLYRHVPAEFKWEPLAVANYSFIDAPVVFSPTPRDALGYSSVVGVLHAAAEPGKGVIGYVAEVEGKEGLVALVGRGGSGLHARRLRRPEEALDVAVVAAELQLDRERRRLFVHRSQVLYDARGEPLSLPVDAIKAGPYLFGAPALAPYAKGTPLAFGAVMEYAIDAAGEVRPAAAAVSAVSPPPLCCGRCASCRRRRSPTQWRR